MPAPTTELDVARAIRDGQAASGTKYGNVWLFAMRVTGTGAAYRSDPEEWCWRDPGLYLNDEFLARCNGLSVILNHPEDASLDTTELRDRVIGSVMLPYIKEADKEVWCIARIYDEPAATFMRSHRLSTSPSLVFKARELHKEKLDDGTIVLVEGNSSLLDHLAVCANGVWDKGGPPVGVDNGSNTVADEKEVEKKPDAAIDEKPEPRPEVKPDKKKADKAKPDAEDEPNDGDIHAKLDAIMDCVGATVKRMDAMEAKYGKADAEAEEKKKAEEEKAKADAQAKADADVAKRLADMEERMKDRPDEEEAEMADAQAKCDSVAMAFGGRAPRPMLGEKPLAYLRRQLKGWQQHSERWKDVNLSELTPSVIKIADAQIRADALAAASAPSAAIEGRLQEITQRINGVDVKTFRGSWNTAFAPFRIKPRKLAGFNTPHGRAA